MANRMTVAWRDVLVRSDPDRCRRCIAVQSWAGAGTPFPGFYLYFPQRRNMAPKLRALIEHVRQWRGV